MYIKSSIHDIYIAALEIMCVTLPNIIYDMPRDVALSLYPHICHDLHKSLKTIKAIYFKQFMLWGGYQILLHLSVYCFTWLSIGSHILYILGIFTFSVPALNTMQQLRSYLIYFNVNYFFPLQQTWYWNKYWIKQLKKY